MVQYHIEPLVGLVHNPPNSQDKSHCLDKLEVLSIKLLKGFEVF